MYLVATPTITLQHKGYVFIRTLVTKKDIIVVCTSICETELHMYVSLQACRSQYKKQNDNFPFKLIHNRKCKEGFLYMKIKTDLNVIHTITEKYLKESINKFRLTVTSW